jgi:tripartite-type tricarboxylate transporter receptor subunit TctC
MPIGAIVRSCAWATGLCLAFAGTPVALAQSADEFYRGKTVTILVGSPPGGGYDAYARMIAPHLAKRLGATVIIENRAGGSGLLALNVLYTSRPDGLTLMHASAEGAILSQLTKRQGARWDVAKLNWLARTSEEPKVWYFGADSKLKTIDDAVKADRIKWSATGPADNISDVAAIVSHVLGLKSEIIGGYKGIPDMSLAVVTGEVDSGIGSASSLLAMIKAGRLRPVAAISRKRFTLLPDLPTIFEAASIPSDKAFWIDLREKIGQTQRAMATGPGVPPDRVAFLREKMREVLTDPAVVDEGNKTSRELAFMPGQELQKLVVDSMTAVTGERLDQMQTILLKTYF